MLCGCPPTSQLLSLNSSLCSILHRAEAHNGFPLQSQASGHSGCSCQGLRDRGICEGKPRGPTGARNQLLKGSPHPKARVVMSLALGSETQLR